MIYRERVLLFDVIVCALISVNLLTFTFREHHSSVGLMKMSGLRVFLNFSTRGLRSNGTSSLRLHLVGSNRGTARSSARNIVNASHQWMRIVQANTLFSFHTSCSGRFVYARFYFRGSSLLHWTYVFASHSRIEHARGRFTHITLVALTSEKEHAPVPSRVELTFAESTSRSTDNSSSLANLG